MKSHEPLYQGTSLIDKLRDLNGWSEDGGWLAREYRTDGWRSTMMVVNAIAFIAEAANHHPDLEVHWGSVLVRLQTHSAGGITDKDVQLAQLIEQQVTWRPTAGFPGLEGQASEWIRS